MHYTRRQAVGLGVAFGSGVLLGGSFATCVHTRPSGPLRLQRDETTGLALLELPEGFRYRSFGWTRDPLANGARIPPRVDGMGVIPNADGTLALVRNHEVPYASGAFAQAVPTYDPRVGGGTTTLRFDPGREALIDASASLCGTLYNCSGGVTPWQSWLTCEEDVRGGEELAPGARRHGYVFEVPVSAPASALPLVGLGRFRHEAAAVDPASGVVYQTEDEPRSGLYRFVPAKRGQLAAPGRLEMLAVRGAPRFDARRGRRVGETHGVEWVPIERPDPDDARGAGRVFAQGRARGGALFSRLEGAQVARGLLYFVSTDGGAASAGQVWTFDPAAERLELLFESSDPRVLDHPDNVAIHPERGAVLCEDGDGRALIRGLSRRGEVFPFARSRVELDGEPHGLRGDFGGSEFTGPAFDPTGRWLFVNVQNPGFTLAITGPWEQLPFG
jgi:hypothetical protein